METCYISCKKCNRKLVTCEKIEDSDMSWNVFAFCPYCKIDSEKQVITGAFGFAGYHVVIPSNDEKKPDIIMVHTDLVDTEEDLDTNTVKFIVVRGK